MKLLVINNMVSGYGDGAIYDFMRQVMQDGDEICIRGTDGTTDIARLVEDAERFDAVVASGGDGTVAAVCYHLAGSGIPILPFPAGTANLLALNLQSPTETHALAKLLQTGDTLDFDLGELEADGCKVGFDIMAGAGYDAVIMNGAKPYKRILGPAAYFSAAVANVAPPVSHITLEIDGKTYESEGIGVLVVNFSKIQFDISVTHDNRPRDGYLDIAILKGKTVLDLVPALGAALLDREGGNPDRTSAIELHQAKEARIIADPPMQIQFDGEVASATTPFTVRVLPNASRFIVNEAGYKLFATEEELEALEE